MRKSLGWSLGIGLMMGAAAAERESVFWLEPEGSPATKTAAIRRADVDGSARCTLAEGALNAANLTLGRGGQKIYWLEGEPEAAGVVRGMSLDGGAPATLATLSANTRDYQVDDVAAFLYHADGEAIYRRALPDGPDEALVSFVDDLDLEDFGIAAFAAAPSQNLLFWVQTAHGRLSLYRSTLDGEEITALAFLGIDIANQVFVNQLIFDAEDERLYWDQTEEFVDPLDGFLEYARIYRVRTDGEDLEVFYDSNFPIQNFALPSQPHHLLLARFNQILLIDVANIDGQAIRVGSGGIDSLVTATRIEPEPAPRLIPHLTTNQGGFQSTLTFFNTHSDEAAVRLIGHLADGSPLEPLERMVAANASLRFGKDELWPEADVSHAFIETAEGPRLGVAYQIKDGAGNPVHVRETSVIARRWLIYAGNPTLVWDGFAAVNLGDQPAAIHALLKNVADVRLSQVDLSEGLPPNAKLLHAFSTSPLEGGYYEIVADQPISLMALQGSPDSRIMWENRAVPLE